MKLPNMRKIHLIVAVLALFAIMPCARASADSIVYDITLGGAGGSSSFDGTNLSGIVTVNSIQSTTFNPLVVNPAVAISGGQMQLFGVTASYNNDNSWTIDDGGTFQITGALPGGAPTILLTGNLDGGTILKKGGNSMTENLFFSGGVFDPSISSWVNFEGSITLNFFANIQPNGNFDSVNAPGGNVNAFGVPLPSSAFLLGFGLLGLAGLRMRKPFQD
ncbi:MAG: hypothetical protein AAGU11_08195 [Syntrophobacteraceae bacterium]